MTRLLPAIDLPTAKGLLWVASDGNNDLQPEMVWFLLKRILQKKHQDGTPQYSNIHALAYFNPRRLVSLPNSAEPTLFWFSGSRERSDEQMLAFLNLLCESWYQYVEAVRGIRIRRVTEESTPDGLRFLGVPSRMPLIDVRGY